MEKPSISYFRNLLDKHANELKDLCKEWEEFCTGDIPNEVTAEIRTTIGLTNLLLGQKLKQFSGLIDDSENKRGEKEINCEDLQGFWDMVYQEVVKIQKGFKKLEECRSNGWVFVEQTNKPEIKKKPAVINPKIATAAKTHAAAARQRLAEAKLKMKAQLAVQKLENVPTKDNAVENAKICLKTDLTEQNKTKDALKNIENMEFSDVVEKVQENERQKRTKPQKGTKIVQSQDAIKEVSPKKQKLEDKTSKSKKGSKPIGRKKALAVADENLPVVTPSRSKDSKSEFIPLQCITRSAAKRELSEKNATHKN